MLEPFVVAALPTLFLATLICGGAAMRRRNIDMEGIPPIDKNLFRLSKQQYEEYCRRVGRYL